MLKANSTAFVTLILVERPFSSIIWPVYRLIHAALNLAELIDNWKCKMGERKKKKSKRGTTCLWEDFEESKEQFAQVDARIRDRHSTQLDVVAL